MFSAVATGPSPLTDLLIIEQAFCETTHGARLPCRPFPRARPASAQSFSSANLAAAARWLAASGRFATTASSAAVART